MLISRSLSRRVSREERQLARRRQAGICDRRKTHTSSSLGGMSSSQAGFVSLQPWRSAAVDGNNEQKVEFEFIGVSHPPRVAQAIEEVWKLAGSQHYSVIERPSLPTVLVRLKRLLCEFCMRTQQLASTGNLKLSFLNQKLLLLLRDMQRGGGESCMKEPQL
jgi:hypothetical protein